MNIYAIGILYGDEYALYRRLHALRGITHTTSLIEVETIHPQFPRVAFASLLILLLAKLASLATLREYVV